jgi:hypothetical protein
MTDILLDKSLKERMQNEEDNKIDEEPDSSEGEDYI